MLFHEYNITNKYIRPLGKHYCTLQCCHCKKRIQIEFFPVIFSRIRTEYGAEKTPYLDTFHGTLFETSKILIIVQATETVKERKFFGQACVL